MSKPHRLVLQSLFMGYDAIQIADSLEHGIYILYPSASYYLHICIVIDVSMWKPYEVPTGFMCLLLLVIL